MVGTACRGVLVRIPSTSKSTWTSHTDRSRRCKIHSIRDTVVCPPDTSAVPPSENPEGCTDHAMKDMHGPAWYAYMQSKTVSSGACVVAQKAAK